jgi:soluble lytic murein transglycosylase
VKRLLIILIPLLLLAVGVAIFWWWEEKIEHRYDPQIAAAAQRYGVDPALVKAIVWHESRFHADARGTKGEIGLMQIRDIAAQEWADSERLKTFDHEHCVDPATNTLAGTFYLSKLLRRYTNTDNPLPYALADYNAGRSYVLKWMSGSAVTNSAVFVEQIAFPGTKEYIQSVTTQRDRFWPAFHPQGQ